MRRTGCNCRSGCYRREAGKSGCESVSATYPVTQAPRGGRFRIQDAGWVSAGRCTSGGRRVTGSGFRRRRFHTWRGVLNFLESAGCEHYTQNFPTVKRMGVAPGAFSPGARRRVDSGQKFLPGKTDWTKTFRLLSWVLVVPEPSGGPFSGEVWSSLWQHPLRYPPWPGCATTVPYVCC